MPMRRLQYHRYGRPDVMAVEPFDLSDPGTGEVVVAVSHAAINPIDWKQRNGQMKIVTGREFPRGMGMDLAGTVLSVGAGVTRLAPGDPVFGLARFREAGAIGEAVVTKADFLAIRPDGVAPADAAILGTAGVTAWNGLIDKAGLRGGQHVFINGCMGAVGRAAVQVARLSGAIVSGSCGADDMDAARDLGVTTIYDYRRAEVAAIGERFDVVFDTAATLTVAEGLRLVRRGGVLADLNPDLGKFMRALVDRRLKPVLCAPRPEILAWLATAAHDGQFRLPIGTIVPLVEAPRIIADLENGRRIGGKAVVTMA